MKMTSLTHPLRIAAVSAGAGCGRIGITLCPGKHDPYGITGYWERDLGLDLKAIRAWGAAAVVTLIEREKLAEYWVDGLGEGVRRRNMAWFHLPIADGSIPDERFEEQWAIAGKELRSILRSGRDVLVHCRGGLGRAGTVAARLLIELGMRPDAAIAAVRSARPGAIETPAQEKYVLSMVPVRD